MIVHRQFQIDKVCSSDPDRVPLNEVSFEKATEGSDNGLLVATDGSMLLAVKVIGTADDRPGMLPPLTFEMARRATSAKQPEAAVVVLDEVSIKGAKNTEVRLQRSYNKDFPDWQSALPKASKDLVTIGLDAERLYRLAKAMGTKTVSITIKPSDALHAIGVRPLDTDKDREVYAAVLMPVRVG